MLQIKSLKHYFVAVPIASMWLSIILFYTRGGLLVGGDWPGYYDAFMAIKTGNPNAIIYGIGLLLANGNVYSGFYIGTFIGICLNLMALSYFLAVLFDEWREKVALYVIASILYAFNMFSVYNTFKSIVGLASINIAGLLLFLAQIIRFYRYMNSSYNFAKLDCFLMGFGIAVSSAVPPNSFRILLMEGLIVIALLSLTLIKRTVKRAPALSVNNINKVITKLALVASVAVLGMLYWEVPFFLSFKESIETALYAAETHGLTSFPHAPYASLINTFRIFGVWAFPTGYCPYHNLYFQDPLITITSFMWPVTALGLSTLLASRDQRSKILSLVVLSLLVISWDTADNPPVGPMNKLIASLTPVLVAFFPTYFLSGTLLPILYITLSTYVIARVLELLSDFKKKVSSHPRRIPTAAVTAILLMAVLLIPDMPFFTGESLGQYFDPSIRGIWIPQDYFEARNILSNAKGKVLILPSLTTYVQTSWGYQGSSYFYYVFFERNSPIVPQNPIFRTGGYTLYNPKASSLYFSLTTPPLQANTSSIDVMGLDYDKITVWGAKYVQTAGNLTIYNAEAGHIDISIPTLHPYDATPYQFFVLKIRLYPAEPSLIDSGKLWIGISSPGTIGWYILGSTSNTYFVNDSEVTISMRIGSPDKPWPASTYDPSNITGIILRIRTDGLPPRFQKLTLSISLGLAHPTINRSQLDLWTSYGIEYLLIDKSIVQGSAVDPLMYNNAINMLISSGFLRPVYIGRYIELYRFHA